MDQIYTHHDTPTVCAIKNNKVFFPLDDVSKKSFATMVEYELISGFS